MEEDSIQQRAEVALSLSRQNERKVGLSIPEQNRPFKMLFGAIGYDGEISTLPDDIIPMASTVKVPVAEEMAQYFIEQGLNAADISIPVDSYQLALELGVSIEQLAQYHPALPSGLMDFETFCMLALNRSSNIAFGAGKAYLINQIGFDELQTRIQNRIPSAMLLESSDNYGVLRSPGGNSARFNDLLRYYHEFISDALSITNDNTLKASYYNAMLRGMKNNDQFSTGLYSIARSIYPRGTDFYEKVGIVPPTWDNMRLAENGYPFHIGYLTFGTIVIDGRLMSVGYAQMISIPLPDGLDRDGMPDENEFKYKVLVRLKDLLNKVMFTRNFRSHLQMNIINHS